MGVSDEEFYARFNCRAQQRSAKLRDVSFVYSFEKSMNLHDQLTGYDPLTYPPTQANCLSALISNY